MKLAAILALLLSTTQAFTAPRAFSARRPSTSLNVADDAKVVLITGSSQGKAKNEVMLPSKSYLATQEEMSDAHLWRSCVILDTHLWHSCVIQGADQVMHC